MRIETRPARPEDAEQAVFVLRASISELCVADHKNDAAALERWLANKTTEHFQHWLGDSETFILVSEIAGTIRGVALLRRLGEVQLCYVEPGFQGRGIGRALLEALEVRARAWGLSRLYLNSSHVARSFYEHHGFSKAGQGAAVLGFLRCYPYAKSISGDS